MGAGRDLSLVVSEWQDVCFQAGVFVFPGVQFGGATVTVYPVEQQVYTRQGQFVLRRVALPLVSGHAVRFGLSLGCTLEAGMHLFMNLSGAREDGTSPFMGLTRHGDLERVYFDADTPISADMFAVPQAVREFFESPDWVEVAVPADPARGVSRRHGHGLGAV